VARASDGRGCSDEEGGRGRATAARAMNPSGFTLLACAAFLWAAVGNSWIVTRVGSFNDGIPVRVGPGGIRMNDSTFSFHSQLCFDDCAQLAAAGDAAKILLIISGAVMACASVAYGLPVSRVSRYARYGSPATGAARLRASLLLLTTATVLAAAGAIFFVATCAVAAQNMNSTFAPVVAPWAKYLPSSTHHHRMARPGIHLLVLVAGVACAVGGGSRLRVELRAAESPNEEEAAALRAGFLGV
jgi:hypothetical protein